MIRIRNATVADINAAAQNPMPVFDNGVDHKPGCMHCLSNGWLYALEDEDNNLCGVMGGFFIWGGVASVGAIFTPHLTKYKVAAMRAVERSIAKGMEEWNVHRVEMAVQADYKTGHRWAKALGFEAEGLMRKYGADKQDHVMYGRVK